MEVQHPIRSARGRSHDEPLPLPPLGAPTTQGDDHHFHVAESGRGCGEALGGLLQRSCLTPLTLLCFEWLHRWPVCLVLATLMMGGVPPEPKVVRQPLVLLLRQRTSDSFPFCRSHACAALFDVPQDTPWPSRTSASWPPWPPSSWLSPSGQCIERRKYGLLRPENSSSSRLMLISRGLTAYPSVMSVIGACRYAFSGCF
jgi:hypothetical protein